MDNHAISKQSPIPLYHQLKELLRDQIRQGQFNTGDLLPSVSEIVNTYQVSRHVANRALADLAQEGLVLTRKGVGTFVNSGRLTKKLAILGSFSQRLRSLSTDSHVRVLKIVTSEADPIVQTTLGLSPGSQVVQVERVGTVNGIQLAMLCTQLPIEIGNFLLSVELTDQSIYSLLSRERGIEPSRAETILSLTFATLYQASILDVKVGFPLMTCRSVTFDQYGNPFEFSEESYASDKVEFTFTSSHL